MPTYARRTGYTGTIHEHGVFCDVGSPTLATYAILTEAVLTFADTEDFAVGEQVEEGTSAITGRVYWKTGTQLGIIEASGVFTGGETITGATSGEILTPTAVENRLERTAATPTKTNLNTTHSLSSTGTGDDKTVYLHEGTACIRIWNVVSADVTVCNQTTATVLNVIPAGKRWTCPVNYEVAKLILQFSAAGTCRLDEYTTSSLTGIELE